MNKNIFFIWIISLSFTACVSASPATPQPTQTPTNIAVSETLTETLAPSRFPSHTPTSVPSHTSTVGSSPSATVINRKTCPIKLASDSPEFLGGGTVLFRYNGVGATRELWGVSINSREIQLVLPAKESPLELSADGTKLTWGDKSKAPWEIVVEDLATQQQIRIPAEADWQYIRNWTPDGRLVIFIEGESLPWQGITETRAYLDIQTKKAETVTLELDLPGYQFSPYDSISGSASIDPSWTLVLYTASQEANEVVLQEIQTGAELWQKEGLVIPPFPVPDWTEDGSRVGFAMWLEGETFMKIYSLSRDGQELLALTQQPLGEQISDSVRALQWSPDGRYLYFALRNTIAVTTGPAYILDTSSTAIYKICTPGYTFLDGRWLPTENQFVYEVQQGADANPTGRQELRILDVNKWQELTLVPGKTDQYTYVLGWTPLEFPSLGVGSGD